MKKSRVCFNKVLVCENWGRDGADFLCWFAILICQKKCKVRGGHANLGNLLKVSRGGRGEHGVGTGFAVIGVSHKRSSTPNGAKVKSIESMNI